MAFITKLKLSYQVYFETILLGSFTEFMKNKPVFISIYN